MASVKNLASGTLVSGINTTDTSLTVNVGNGTSAQLLGVWPSVPFYITVAPSSPSSGVTNSLDSEIMLVTSIKTGTSTLNMTVTRAQRDTTAKAFNADDIVTNAVYAEDAVFAAPNGTLESPSPWIETGDIKNGAVTPAKLENGNIYDKLVAVGGTEITSNADLNTITYLDIGMYYCVADNVATTLTNCPTGSAFTMRVYRSSSGTNPDITTDTWVYLLREITTWDGKKYYQYVFSDSTPANFTYGTWAKSIDSTQVKTLNAQSDAGWSADRDYIPDLGFMAYWNGAYSGTASNLKYFASDSVTASNLQNGCIDPDKFNDWQTANTTDTWVLVTSVDKIQHRLIKPFNADGSIPTTALGFDVPTMNTLNGCDGNSWYWKKLGHITLDVHSQGQFVYLKIFIGNGNNSRTDQNAYIDLIGQLGWTGDTLQGRYGWNAVLHPLNSPFTTSNVNMKVTSSDNLNYDIWIMIGNTYCRPNVMFFPTFNDDGTLSQNTHFTASLDNWQAGEPSGTACNLLVQQAAV